ncbi:cation:proton antiporter domain-containing protein [Spirochaeta lutea]|uniref:PTS EIIA type-2 domain-containing protein n=1 Tax=Spirochaeta lutea TaxID=1480694 RepID=A0A098QVP3_9SPIO|nr:cation:proton antiporter [Spirochaeta lutea]KGE71463.1 hypothetical protein DC28_11860 [Spirochaeta lutea]
MNHTGLPSLPFTDPVLIFGTVMALLLIAPLAARKLRLPELIGLIIAGVVIGPYGLGVLARDQTVELLGKVGLMYIMFLAGLEIDLNQVKSNRGPTLIFGLLTFSIPLVLGTALGMGVFAMSFPVAVLLASMFSSHTLLTMPAAGKLGLTKHPVVTTAVGGTIITDTLALIILAIVTSSSQGSTDLWFWLRLFGFMAAYTVAMVLLIPRLARWFFRHFGRDETLEFVFVIAVTFMAGYLAYMSGLEPIIGAFLAGLTLNSLIPEKSLLMTRIHFTGDAIFIPFFMLSVGMLVDISLFLQPGPVWIIIGGMIITALVSKWFASKLAQVILGLSGPEGSLLYGLTVNQAAATLAAVLVGFNLGLFSQEIISGTILMIGITCLAGSIITDRRGRQIALSLTQEPSLPRNPGGLTDRILIPQHSKDQTKQLVDLALLLSGGTSTTTLLPMRVALEGSESEKEIAQSEAILAHAVVRILSAGGEAQPVTTLDINVPRGILRALREQRATCLLMPWDGDPAPRYRVFSRTIDQCLSSSTQAALIFRPSARLENARRCHIIIPPLMHHHPGFTAALSLLVPLANQAGVSLQISAQPREIAVSKRVLGQIKSLPETEYTPLPQWTFLRQHLSQGVHPQDLVVLLMPRQEELSWQPKLNRLPKLLSELFPRNPLLCLLPPRTPQAPQEQDLPLPKSLESTPFQLDEPPVTYLFGFPNPQIKELCSELIARMPDIAPSSRLIQDLLRISQEEPVLLVDQVVLIHSHRKEVHKTQIAIGTADQDIRLPLVDQSIRVVVLLLNPLDQDPSVHLQILSRIARMIHRPEYLPALLSSRSQEEFQEKLSRIRGE